MSPFFSIITPVRNGENFLNRYLRCLFDQTFKNFEVIIIDDQSIDRSYLKLKKETNNDERFSIIRLNSEKEINGPYLARNTAIEISKGKYICFLDIDDYWLPNKLQRNYEILSANKSIKFIYSNYLRYNLKSKEFFLRSPLIIFNINISLFFFNPIPLLTVCLKRDLLKKDIRFKSINHEDFVFWNDLLPRLSKEMIFLDDKPFSIYSLYDSSLSSSKLNSILWLFRIYRKKNGLLLSFLILFIRLNLQFLIYIKDKKIIFKNKSVEF